MAELLIEVGTEEIPARMMAKAAADFAAAVGKLFDEAGLKHDPVEGLAAPRQIALTCRQVEAGQEDREEIISGPPVKIAYDADGQPTKALQGFLRKNPSLDPEKLFRIDQKKGQVVAGKLFVAGQRTEDILAQNLPAILDGLHFAKNMRWGNQSTLFVRPVRNLLALFNGQVVEFNYAGVAAGNRTFGHRFHGTANFEVKGIQHYLDRKAEEGIVCHFEDRKARLQKQIEAHLDSVGGQLVEDPALLNEVADLVESPYIVLGSFDSKFLEIPREVLVTSLREHQKSFCIQDQNGALMPYFLAVASVPGDQKGLIKKGNEWVLNARLWDAKFFWESDIRKDFDDLRNRLKDLMFQEKVGSYYGKSERMEELAATLCKALQFNDEERNYVLTAARHAKTDLVSELVFEFPELQGIVGGLLLRKAGQPESAWRGVYEHYLPMSMDGDLPETLSGALVSLADKVDTLTGCFACGIVPTGAKDPFALRRAAQGIVRILVEHQLPLGWNQILEASLESYRKVTDLPADLAEQLGGFLQDRIRYFLKRRGFAHDLIEAVLAWDTNRVDRTLKRAEAVEARRAKPSFTSLAHNIKRMINVVADEADKLPAFDAGKLSDPAEAALWSAYQNLKPQIETAVADCDYEQAMDLMDQLADPIEHYFGTDGVYINVEDDSIRLNRKSMIDQVRVTLGLVADLSRLESV